MTSVICGRKSIGETSEYKEVGCEPQKQRFSFLPEETAGNPVQVCRVLAGLLLAMAREVNVLSCNPA